MLIPKNPKHGVLVTLSFSEIKMAISFDENDKMFAHPRLVTALWCSLRQSP